MGFEQNGIDQLEVQQLNCGKEYFGIAVSPDRSADEVLSGFLKGKMEHRTDEHSVQGEPEKEMSPVKAVLFHIGDKEYEVSRLPSSCVNDLESSFESCLLDEDQAVPYEGELLREVKDCTTALSEEASGHTAWRRLADAKLAACRIAHIRELAAAPASAQAMVSRGHDYCDSDEDVVEGCDVAVPSTGKDLLASASDQKGPGNDSHHNRLGRSDASSAISTEDEESDASDNDENEEKVNVISNFVDELDRLTSAARNDPVARGLAKQLIARTAKSLGVPVKELIANLREAKTAVGADASQSS